MSKNTADTAYPYPPPISRSRKYFRRRRSNYSTFLTILVSRPYHHAFGLIINFPQLRMRGISKYQLRAPQHVGSAKGLGAWKLMQTALTDRNASYFSGSCCSSQVDLLSSLVGATRDSQTTKNGVRRWRTVYSHDFPECMPSTIVSRPCVLLAPI